MGHCVDTLGVRERVVVVVGWRDKEIARERGFGLPNQKLSAMRSASVSC